MTTEQKRRAEALLAAMGELDDRYVVETIDALAAPKPHRQPRRRWRFPTIAASILLAFAVALAGGRAIGSMLRPSGGTERPPSEQDGALAYGAQAFSVLLLSCTESGGFQLIDAVSLPSDGTFRVLVGTERGEGLWVSRPLTDGERETALRETAVGRDPWVGADSDSTAPQSGTGRIWLLDEQGAIWSPELYFSSGNVTFGTTYSYDPERLPSAAFQRLLADLVGRATRKEQ